MKRFVYIWEYFVKEKFLFQFIEIYNPVGEWAQLFKKGKGYAGTKFYQDPDNPCRFITVDAWESKQLRDQFLIEFSEEYEILDKKCEPLIEDEKLIGDFNEI